MARLIIASPDGKKGVLQLGKPVTTVGRGNANDLVLNDSSVSRFHAVIKLNDRAVLIADRGSTNGVVVNGRRIKGESNLKAGDAVRIGRYELRLESLADETQDEKAIRIRRSEWSSTLDHIIHGTAAAPRQAEDAGRQAADLAGRIKKLERENYLLTMLYDAGKALNAKLSVDDISDQVLSLAFRIEGVERGFVMFFDESGQPARGRESQVRYRNPQAAENQPKFILSRSVLETIKKERQPNPDR